MPDNFYQNFKVGKTSADFGAEFDAQGTLKAAEKVRDRAEKRSESISGHVETDRAGKR